MHAFGHSPGQWPLEQASANRFRGLLVLALSLVLFTAPLPASAASADPLAEADDPVNGNTVTENSAAAESGADNSDEPIVIELDLPPELQTFLAEQEASRLAETAAKDQPSEATLNPAETETPHPRLCAAPYSSSSAGPLPAATSRASSQAARVTSRR